MSGKSSNEEAREPETALGLLNYANSYLGTARYLVHAVAEDRLRLAFDDPISLLVGHCLELQFKAYLRSKGWSDAKLRKLGHDLIALEGQERNCGFPDVMSVVERQHLTLLNEQFGKAPYPVRHFKTGSYTVHDDARMVALAGRIDKAIRPAISA